MNKLILLLASAILLQYCNGALKGANLLRAGKNLFATISLSSVVASGFIPQPSSAFGPQDVDIRITNYKQVDLCFGKKPIMPGQKAAFGLFPICIEVDADFNNPSSKNLKDVSVYGFVKEDLAGNSVLPNNPDFKSDSGQYAMVKEIPPGKSVQTFQFVAASQTPATEPTPKLTFFKTKAISFPGGNKFQPLDECEIDPRAEGCKMNTDDD